MYPRSWHLPDREGWVLYYEYCLRDSWHPYLLALYPASRDEAASVTAESLESV
jgi:hypothetical protein